MMSITDKGHFAGTHFVDSVSVGSVWRRLKTLMLPGVVIFVVVLLGRLLVTGHPFVAIWAAAMLFCWAFVAGAMKASGE